MRWNSFFAGMLATVLAASLPADGRDRLVSVCPQSFEGGWALDSQFLDVIGSPCLLAHGMGRPVPDARAAVELPETGRWRVAVRTKNWLPEACAYPTSAPDHPGTFRVLVDGRPLEKTFGRGPKAWTWEDGGEVDCAARRVTVTLRDEDGFDGRCAGVVFFRGCFPLAPEAALDVRKDPVAERSSYDLVVVGGGVPGCCAAVAAARAGIRVALVQDRPVLGGNASSEIRVYSAGEQRHPIVKEMRSLFMNRDADNAVSDAVRLAKLEREPNLTLFLSHRVFAAETDGARIRAAKAIDLTRNRVVAFEGRYFVDATGDGWLGFYAGADYRQGREGRDEYGESFAPERADRGTLGASLMWKSSEANVDVPFAAPWAEPFACGQAVVNGEWNWEYGLDRDVVAEGEEVRDRLLLAVYGAFSRAKRKAVHSRRVLTTLPFLLGKRESRRLMGDWIYRQADVEKLVPFEDAVATGSWSVDLHYVIDPEVPFLTRCEQPHFGRYWIPYRTIYSRNVENLFMAGRCFSCTHVGLGGPRVINTLSQLGVAAGTAAAMCCESGETPRQLYENGRVRELQRRLGGDWPGNPDPARRDWSVVDDEDAAVTFVGAWREDFQCNGGQVGNRSHLLAASRAKGAKAVYPLPVPKAGRYRLKGNTPWCWGTERYGLGEVALALVSDGRTHALAWNQAAGNGDWVDLGVFDLRPGATLEILPGASGAATVYADGFALVPEDAPPGADAVDRFVRAAREAYAKDPDCRTSIVARYAKNNVVDVPRENPAWVDDKKPGVVTWVDVGGIRNVRDIGGWTGLKPGMVYRGTEMSVIRTKDGNSHGYALTAEGRRRLLDDLGVRSDFDLRAVDAASRGAFVTESPLGKDVTLLDHPIGSYMDIYGYRKPLEYGKALREFARKEIYPTYVHCAGGADRTGTLCFLLETLCGVSVADATIDYELTSFSPVGLRFRSREAVQPFALVVRTMNAFPGKTFADKVAYWAEKVAGVSAAEIAAIRTNLTQTAD